VSVTAWLAISKLVVVVWVPSEVQVVLEVVVAGGAIIVCGDVAVAKGSSGCKRRGWRVGLDAVGWFGSVCHCFEGLGAISELGERWWWLSMRLVSVMAAVQVLSAVTW
jgi:hypothetical protein